MAYRIKRVRFQNTLRTILLQNENGPCPLLAVANVLLLKGIVSLPSSCLRSGVASIEELVTVLADRALERCAQITQIKPTSNKSTPLKKEKAAIRRLFERFSSSTIGSSNGHDNDVVLSIEEEEAIYFRKKQSQHMVDELMQILPNLQYGMDVNPKFTQGPEGYEFTIGLTAFDILGVDLVHGWLLPPKDNEDTSSLVNIIGTKTYNELIEIVVQGNDAVEKIKKVEKEVFSEELPNIMAALETENGTMSHASNRVDENNDDQIETSDRKGTNEGKEINSHNEPNNPFATSDSPRSDARQQMKEMEELATSGQMVNSFLRESAHQLTSYGLEKLREHINDGDICVFFRNNHFSSIMKHSGQLFLLVTDLGYAGVEEVVWERLDAINGNTDYFNSEFIKSEAMVSEDFPILAGNTPGLTPEQMLALRGQTDYDYQLAMQLATNSTRSLIKSDVVGNEDEQVLAGMSNVGNSELDHNLALRLQNQYTNEDASEVLARQLHTEEQMKAKRRYDREKRMAGANSKKSPQTSSESGCVIS